MSDHIVSVDAGNGMVNAVLARPGGKYRSVAFPSVRAAATGDSLGLDDFELKYFYADWNGFRYVVGDDVTRVTRRHLERHTGGNRYGNELHAFLIAVALARLGIKSGTVDLTVFAPPGMFREARETMPGRLMEYDGQVTIKLSTDKRPRSWQYQKITVWPEGIGAAACFILDAKGQPSGSDALAGDVVILDSGVHTLDALVLSDGNFNPENLQSTTYEDGGIDTHIRQPILQALKKVSDDFAPISVDDVDRAIRTGLDTGDYTLTSGGASVDLQKLLDKYRERYAEWVGNNIIDGPLDGLRGIKSLILVGGGAVLIEDHIKRWHGDKLLDRTKSPEIKKIHPVDLNAVGGLRLALMQGKHK